MAAADRSAAGRLERGRPVETRREHPETVLGALTLSAMVSGTVSDETDLVESERSRREAQNQFEIGFEQSAIGAVIIDLEGVPQRVNSALCTILGRSKGALVGRRWTEHGPRRSAARAGDAAEDPQRPRHLRR